MSNFANRFPFKNLSASQKYQHKWELQYQKLLLRFLKDPKHATFDGSQVSSWMRGKGLHDPLHHNYWGAQISYYAALGWFKKIGHQAPKGSAAHINEVALWQVVKNTGKI